MKDEFRSRLSDLRIRLELLLDRLLAPTATGGEIVRPARLLAAMRHAALDGGKRLRPFFVVETARLFGVEGEGPLRAGAALECVHCYSLVHDDLPAMDDDDLRRGRPTVHRAFDEATAILAGDALLTLAFAVLADPSTHPDGAIRAGLVANLAAASGIGGMAGGQMIDLLSEGRDLSTEDIRTLQAMKTGALFRHACEAGAIVAGASAEDRGLMRDFGARLGLAFQLADDLLDVTADASQAGKRTAKDAERGKATQVALLGPKKAADLLTVTLDEAVAMLAPYGARADMLAAAARSIGEGGGG